MRFCFCPSRTLRPVLAISALSFALLGCGGEGASADAANITDVPNSSVKSQAIGNCWTYATNGWAEALRLGHAGER